MAFAIEESHRLNVRPDALQEMELSSGPWLNQLKRLVRERHPAQTRFKAPLSRGDEKELTLQEWRDRLIVERKGQNIAYVVDNQYNSGNSERIVSLAENADLFYCEAAFAELEKSIAKDRYHLTATQAGKLARRAHVRQLVPFHFSSRYRSDPNRLPEEALKAFTAEATQTPELGASVSK